MKIKCSNCGMLYRIDESKISEKSVIVRCKKCQAKICISKEAQTLSQSDAQEKKLVQNVKIIPQTTGSPDTKLLKAIFKQVQSLSEEIQQLKDFIKDSQENNQQVTADTLLNNQTDVQNEISPPPPEIDEIHDESNKAVNWLMLQGIEIKSCKSKNKTDFIFDELATFLGERFKTLKPFHDLIRRNLDGGNGVRLDLSSSSQEEVANTTQFCHSLSKFAFLSSYKYSKSTKKLYATPQKVGKIINFFTGEWFERFVCLQLISLLSKHSIKYDYLMNAQIVLPNGDNFELDLMFFIQNSPLWIECKTGDYQAHVSKYSAMRSLLKVSKEYSVLIILGIPDDLASNLTELYGMTIVNENNFISHISRILGIIAQPQENISQPVRGYTGSGSILTELNKVGLRPLPEFRSQVINILIELSRDLQASITIADMKKEIAKRISNISNSKLQDIINAIARGGCFINEGGNSNISFAFPFSHLISFDADIIEQKCMESYIRALLQNRPDFFCHEEKIKEFCQITGGKMPDESTLESLKNETGL